MITPEAITGLLLSYKYFLLIPLAIVAQPLAGISAGALLSVGYIDILPAYLCLMGAALFGDILWYFVGFRYGHSFVLSYGKYVSITEERVAVAKGIFHRYHAPILLISKMTNGFGFSIVTLFTAGLTRIPFRRYFLLNLFGEAIWSAVLLWVGYFFSEAYLKIDNFFGRTFLVILLCLLVLGSVGFARYLRGSLDK